jgi:hypothetical protein
MTHTVQHTNGQALYLNRMLLSNAERVESPMPADDAFVIARERGVPFDGRMMAMNSLINTAIRGEKESGKLWGQIGTMFMDELTDEELPSAILERFLNAVPFKGMRAWARRKLMQRIYYNGEAQIAA